MPDLQLDAQFLDDLNRLEDRCARLEAELKDRPGPTSTPPAGPTRAEIEAETAALRARIEELETRLAEEAQTRRSAAVASNHEPDADREQLEADLQTAEAARQKLEGQLRSTLRMREQLLTRLQDADDAREKLEARLETANRALETEADRLRKKFDAARDEAKRVLRQRLDAGNRAAREEAAQAAETALERLAYATLGDRLAAWLLDVLIVVGLWLGPAWARGESPGGPVALAFWVFVVRSVFSPGRWLLGLSPRRIGPDGLDAGRARLRSRLACGLLHYGPLIVAVVAVQAHPETRDRLARLAAWPWTEHLGSDSLLELLWPATPHAADFLAAWLLVWWAVLLESVLVTTWAYRETPSRQGTTLVESLWPIGLMRSRLSPDSLELDDAPAPDGPANVDDHPDRPASAARSGPAQKTKG